jgi:hypothetical protein
MEQQQPSSPQLNKRNIIRDFHDRKKAIKHDLTRQFQFAKLSGHAMK